MTTDGARKAPAYENDGNTIWSAGIANTFDFKDWMLTHGSLTSTYDELVN